MRAALALALLAGCWGSDAHIIEGTVVRVDGREVLLDHEAVESLGMDAMIMPFQVRDPALVAELEPGDRIVARFFVDAQGGYLAKIRETGRAPVPAMPDAAASVPMPLKPASVLERVEVVFEDGSTGVIGADQGVPTAVTFLYTRCPRPDFCPAVVAKLGALQAALDFPSRAVAVTLDPDHDTVDVLRDFAAAGHLDPARTRLARVEKPALEGLAFAAALAVLREQTEIVHGTRWLVLDAQGLLIERYDDNRWPLERVVDQLRDGEPRAPAGVQGTVTDPR